MPMTPPPDTGADLVPDVKRTAGERIGSAVGGALSAFGGGSPSDSPLDAAIQKHHQKRLDEARMYRKNAATFASALATGNDPETGQPLTPEQKQQYQNWYNASWEAYQKAAGVSKETKTAIQQHKGLVDKVIQHGQKQGAGGMTPPPQAAGGAQPEATSAPAKMTPPPGMSPSEEAGVNAPRVAQQQADAREFGAFKKQQDLLHQHKMEEQAALQKAKAQSGPKPRPVQIPATSILDARKTGQLYLDENHKPIDVNSLSDSMGLIGAWVRNDEGQWEKLYTTFSPNQRTVTIGNETFAVSPMDISKLPEGAGADLGQHTTPKAGTHEAPMIGPDGQPVAVQLHTTSTPTTTGIKGRGAAPAAPSAKAPGKAPAGGKVPGGAGTPSPKGGGARPLSALPPGNYNQQLQRITPVREAATQLYGAPDKPGFKGLISYAKVADDQQANDRIGKAWELIRRHMDSARGGAESGDLITMLRNYAGTPGAVAESEVEKLKETLDDLEKHPEESELFNRLFNAYGTIIGLRSLTKGSAAKFSARNMEQEVPIPGVNVRSSRAFRDKLTGPATQITNGFYGTPDMMFKPGEKDFYQKAENSLHSKGGTNKGGITPPPGARTPEQEAEDYINKHRRK